MRNDQLHEQYYSHTWIWEKMKTWTEKTHENETLKKKIKIKRCYHNLKK